MIRLIWAQDRHGVIGVDGGLPWRIPEDASRFRRLTDGQVVVMGRATWDSLPARYRPLPGRSNWVLTRDPGWSAPGARRAGSLDEMIAAAGVGAAGGAADLWVAGGEQVYAAALPLASECHVTRVDVEVAGDTVAPRLEGWVRVPGHPEAGEWRRCPHSGLRFRFEVLVPG